MPLAIKQKSVKVDFLEKVTFSIDHSKIPQWILSGYRRILTVRSDHLS